MRRCADLGPIFEMHVFAQKFVFIAGTELAAELCDETRFHKALSPSVAALRDFAGDGLFTAYHDDPNWRLAHDLQRPAFTQEAMQRYHPIMLSAACELFETWDRHHGPGDVSAGMTKLTLETISRTAFSRDFGSFTRKDPPHSSWRWSPRCGPASERASLTRCLALPCPRAGLTVATPITGDTSTH